MSYVNHEISALISIDPQSAKEKILKALRDAKMHKETAAESLACNNSTLFRWIKRLRLESDVRKLTKRAKKEGWYHGRKGGRPTGTTVANGAAPRRRRAKPG